MIVVLCNEEVLVSCPLTEGMSDVQMLNFQKSLSSIVTVVFRRSFPVAKGRSAIDAKDVTSVELVEAHFIVSYVYACMDVGKAVVCIILH
jgi:hypothetical protein